MESIPERAPYKYRDNISITVSRKDTVLNIKGQWELSFKIIFPKISDLTPLLTLFQFVSHINLSARKPSSPSY